MEHYAVYRVESISDGGKIVRTRLITPWTAHRDLAEASLAEHRKQDPTRIYGLMSLSR